MSAEQTPIVSLSVEIKPQDSRCRYWAKVIRAGQPLPVPYDVSSANHVPGAYARRGSEELLPGDVLIEGEEEHHRKARGWFYQMTVCRSDGTAEDFRPSATLKAQLKTAGMAPELLTGSGDIAALIRVLHGIRAGFI